MLHHFLKNCFLNNYKYKKSSIIEYIINLLAVQVCLYLRTNICDLLHKAVWTNSEFPSGFRIDTSLQIQPGLNQVQWAHNACYKHSLSPQGLSQSLWLILKRVHLKVRNLQGTANRTKYKRVSVWFISPYGCFEKYHEFKFHDWFWNELICTLYIVTLVVLAYLSGSH